MSNINKHENIIYRIFDRGTNVAQGAYDRSHQTRYDFGSVDSARNSNAHGIYHDEGKYRIAKYKVTYELLDDDVDASSE